MAPDWVPRLAIFDFGEQIDETGELQGIGTKEYIEIYPYTPTTSPLRVRFEESVGSGD